MAIKRRVFISGPRDPHLDPRHIELKRAVVNEIEKYGYEAQVFGSMDGGKGLAQKSWSPDEADRVMRRCVGAAILGFPIWHFQSGDKTVSLVTEYCHYEGALARAYQIPILAVLEEGVEARGFFLPYGGDPSIQVPAQADHTWVTGPDFGAFMESWIDKLKQRRDIFLGYCSGSKRTAQSIKRYLVDTLQASVLDWYTDFAPADSILDDIQEAESRCSAGIFLFTQDDTSEDEDGVQLAVPRDNVVFEAGYFISAKGKDRVLIVRENGSKLPADLGGDIYAVLDDRGVTSEIKNSIKRFVDQRL
jgi:hypothetical protein